MHGWSRPRRYATKSSGTSAFPKARRKQPESDLQVEIFRHYKIRGAKGTVMFAVPNGGLRSKVEAAIMMATGTLAGAPDICAVRDGRAIFLELKIGNRKLTAAQEEVHQRLRDAGCIVGVERELTSALRFLEQHGILRGHVV
jgi:hypothetical protein